MALIFVLFVLQTSLNDYNVTYELNVYTDQPARIPGIYSALNQSIQDAFNEAGVEIMSPSYSGPRDGNASTVPQDYLRNRIARLVFACMAIPKTSSMLANLQSCNLTADRPPFQYLSPNTRDRV